MTILYVCFVVYILAVNFYAWRFLKSQKEAYETDGTLKGDGKLLLAAVLGGATAIYISMFCMRFRLGNLFFMIFMPLIAVVNIYCFFLGFRGIYMFF